MYFPFWRQTRAGIASRATRGKQEIEPSAQTGAERGCAMGVAPLNTLEFLQESAPSMENIVLTIHLIISLCLIGIVLIQRSEGGGLGIGGGGGGAMTGRPAISALGKLTWLFGIAFVITSITLTVLSTRGAGGGSVLDGTELLPPPSLDAPADDSLLPPSSNDAPLLPPTATE